MPALPLPNLLIALLLTHTSPNTYREASLIGYGQTTSKKVITTRMLAKLRIRLASRRFYRSRLTELCIKGGVNVNRQRTLLQRSHAIGKVFWI